MARKIENLIGVKKGYIKVLGYFGKRKKNHYWVCQCKCGKVVNLQTGRITNDYFPSCGCYRKAIIEKMPKYSKSRLTDETLISLTRNEGQLLLEKTLKLHVGEAKEIYNHWRKSYIYNHGLNIIDIIKLHIPEYKEEG